MYDYKDVYETEDLPEAEKDYEEEIKDCVEKLSITPSTAYNRFRGKDIQIAGALNKSKSAIKTNPYDRARNIISELDLLSKDIQDNYDANSTQQAELVTKDHLLLLVEGLIIQIKEMDLNKYFGPETSFEIKDTRKIIYKKLIQNIDEITDGTSKELGASNPIQSSYVLTSNVAVNEHLDQIKLANLLKRLDVLEKVLGDDNVKLSNVVSDCPNKGLIEAIERLYAKTSLLNNPQLNVIDSRLQAVSKKLQNLTTVASNGDKLDQESQIKIASLYEIVKKWDYVIDAVPNLIDQCVSMQDFHSNSVKLGQCITHIDMKHQQMHFKQQTSQMALKNMQNNLENNFKIMEKNMGIVEEKLKGLS